MERIPSPDLVDLQITEGKHAGSWEVDGYLADAGGRLLRHGRWLSVLSKFTTDICPSLNVYANIPPNSSLDAATPLPCYTVGFPPPSPPQILAFASNVVLSLNLLFLPFISLILSSHTRLSAKQPERPSYNQHIRPILADFCFPVHGPDASHRQADLRLDLRPSAVDQGAIVPGKASDSSLCDRILHSESNTQHMPPPSTRKQLTVEQIATLQRGSTKERIMKSIGHLSPLQKVRFPPTCIPSISFSNNIGKRTGSNLLNPLSHAFASSPILRLDRLPPSTPRRSKPIRKRPLPTDTIAWIESLWQVHISRTNGDWLARSSPFCRYHRLP